jgi:hypothetical protein
MAVIRRFLAATTCLVAVFGSTHARSESYHGAAFCGGLPSLRTKGALRPWSLCPSSDRAACRNHVQPRMALGGGKDEGSSLAARIGRFMAVAGMASSFLIGNGIHIDSNRVLAANIPSADSIAASSARGDMQVPVFKLAAGFPDLSNMKLPDAGQLDQLMGKTDTVPAAPQEASKPPPAPAAAQPASPVKSEAAPTSTAVPKPANPSDASSPSLPIPAMPNLTGKIPGLPNGLPAIPQAPTAEQVIDVIKNSRLPQPGEVIELPTGALARDVCAPL